MKSSAGYRNTDQYLLEVIFNLIESEFKAANSSAETMAKSTVKEQNPVTGASQKAESTGDDLPVQNGTESPKVKEKKRKNKESKVKEESSTENAEPGDEPLDNVDVPESFVNGVCDNHNEDEGFTNVKKSKKKKKEKKDVEVPMEITEAEPNVEDVEMNVQSASNDVSFQNDERIVAKSRGKKKHKHGEDTSVAEPGVVDADKSCELVIPENTDPTCSVVEENFCRKPEKKKKKRKLDQVDAEDDVDSKRSRK